MKVVSLADADAEDRRENANAFREFADRIEAGDIVEWVLVANSREGQHYMTHSNFQDRWRMLGALEYARVPFLRAD